MKKQLLKEFGFHTLQMNGSRCLKISILENLKKNRNELIAYSNKEYHLDL